MRVKQLGQIISWLTILATATLINAEHKYSRKYHDPCPGRSFQVEPYLYGINLALQDGLSSIGGSTDIYLKFKIADVLKEDSGAKGFWDKLRDKDIDDDYERPNRYDPLIMCCEKNQRDCQLNMRMESILDIEDIKDDVRFKKVDKSGGSEEKVKKVLRDGQGLTILIHFKSKFDPGYHGKLSIVYTRHSGAIRHGISESLKASLVSQRFQRDRLNELFPFFNKLESSSSKYEVTIRYPDANGNVFVSNFDRDAYYENKLSHSSRASTGMKETRFKDLRLNDVQELTFAVGPFYRTKIDNHLMKHPTILPQTGSEVLQGFAKRFLEQTLDWLRNYSPANWDDDIDSRIVTGYQFIAIVPQLTNVGPTSPEPTVETALTVALRTARKWLSVFNARYIDSSWIIDGLAVHFAIRMVRELEPHLRVDEYVRSTHLAWLIEHEINGHYNDLNVAHSYKYQADGPLEDVWLRRIKFGAFVDMIERNLCRDQQAFDEAVLDLLKDSGSEEITDRKLEERISGEESENFVVWAWAWSVGFPQIGVSLDKKNKSIKLTQVPMIWLYGRGEGKRWIPAWRMSITVKFSNGTKPEQTVHVPMSGGFDGKHDSLIIPLPEWFNYDEPGHKVWLDIQDQEELPYYQVSYSSDLKIKLQDS